ncbi:hypothetical protein SAV14893_007810 [Streptomyces avermitilis]|uniref:Uncharacterized protein n=1 Tax=Streptomyces avermitilis TaxID=33903 RepID=A0A4D4LSI8_STRAX|nr:hypothetical protein SAVMC3_19860 [Streptomyces avermitilis]GDY61388.1 hypothetical protein SAV14893_007810 [Streptomyces avermitilis]GDY78518.1 hypothetical protein SAV31267_080030 [Streptomyces avermitilis]GDY87356.1 hypothetical protein SAVCW2_65550 [Streptomyces avermitilis]
MRGTGHDQVSGRSRSPLGTGRTGRSGAPGWDMREVAKCRECRIRTADLGWKTDAKDGYADHTCHLDAQFVERHR